MAINRLLYSSQTCLITVGGHLKSGNPWYYSENDSAAVKAYATVADGTTTHWSTNGFTYTKDFLLAVQSASVDETIPMDDVLVFGNKDGVGRLQKDVASSKCSVKAYLADWMSWNDGMDSSNPPQPIVRDAGTWSYGNQQTRTGADADNTYPSVDDADIDANSGSTQQGTLEQMFDTAKAGPYGGVTERGYLAGEHMGDSKSVRHQGMLEQLAFESMGGFESRIQLYRPGGNADGFVFYGILSSIGIDASKGAYPTLDLGWEGIGAIDNLYMGSASDAAVDGANAGQWYIESCHPHTSDDVLVWGTEKVYNTTTSTTHASDAFQAVLIASSPNNHWQDESIAGIVGSPTAGDDTYGTNPISDITMGGIRHKEGQDTLASAKFSYDLPTETLTALGQVIVGVTTAVRGGNRTFSKPPYKASLALDGQGLLLAGHYKLDTGQSPAEVEEEVIPHELQIGSLRANCGGSHTLGSNPSTVASRSFSNNVGDVGATYSITVEATEASFYGTNHWQTRVFS